MASAARKAAEAAMLPFRDGPHLTTKVTAEAVWNLAVAMDALLSEQDGAGAKPEPPTPEEVAGYPNDPGHFELGLRLQIARAKGELPSDETPDPAWAAWAESLLEDAIAYRDSAGDPNAPQRPAPSPASDEVRESVLGTCELCRASRRRVHRELPNRFVECHGAGFVWLCKRCGRWNTAINNGKAICCTDPCERGGE